MAKAVWKDVVLAESDHTEIVEGNHYFPPAAVRMEYFKPSEYQSVCPWKGTAHYYHLEVNGEVNENAAWTYPQPKQAAEQIRDHVAFWKGVRIEG